MTSASAKGKAIIRFKSGAMLTLPDVNREEYDCMYNLFANERALVQITVPNKGSVINRGKILYMDFISGENNE